MHSKKLVRVVASLLIGIVLLMVITVNAQDVDEEVAPTLYIGTVTGIEDEFVGISVDGEDVTIYICDGRPDDGTVSIAQWFVGTVTDNAIAITAANGNSVAVALTEDSATGAFTFTDGTAKPFILTLAEGTAALYRSEFAFGDSEYVGGWLVLEDGSVRGAVIEVETQELVPASLVGFPPVEVSD